MTKKEVWKWRKKDENKENERKEKKTSYKKKNLLNVSYETRN